MSQQQGAALQSFNHELVKLLEELSERRAKLQKDIEKEEREKQILDSQLAQLQTKMRDVEAGLARKYETRAEYDKAIKESEDAYTKIIESSQALLSVVKRDSLQLQKSEASVLKTNSVSSSSAHKRQ